MDNKNKATILIVDDKPGNILALENLLVTKDRTILSATNGKEALQTILNKEIDLIILDVQMPDMDGFEVAQILNSNKRTKDIPIIFASAERKEHKFMLKGFEEGAVDYLFKPLDPDIAKAKVAVLLKVQLQKKELIEKNSSLQKSALLINNSADIIGIIDATTLKIEEINKAFTDIVGYSNDEVKGKPLPFFLSTEDKEFIEGLSRTGKERLSFELRIHCKDGSIKWLHWKIVIKDGKWFVNASDISSQKKADEQIQLLNNELQTNIAQLEVSNKELESFSYSISHDLKAPLRALGSYSTLMIEDYMDKLDDDGKKMLSRIGDNAANMTTMVDSLLKFSGLGKKEVEKVDINMQSVVEKCVNDINSSTEHKATVNIHTILPAKGDRLLITHVWMNLISNAIKYSGKTEKPQVDIGSTEEEDDIVYYVKDNGAGFDMAYANKLFGVFQRLHRKEEFEGMGIGLAIAQRIIIRHGGRIWAKGEPSKGATFYFSLKKN